MFVEKNSPSIRLGMLLGIVFTFAVWVLTAHYVVFFQKVLKLERMPDMLITLSTELFLVFLFMFLICLGFSLPKGMSYLKCKKPKEVLCLGILGTICLWLYSLAITGPKTVNNIMTFSVGGIFGFVLLFFFLKIKFNKLSLIGVVLGVGAVFFVVSLSVLPSFYNITIGRSFATLSGLLLVMIMVIISSIIEKESPLRIALYYSLTGCILSGIVLFFLKLKAQVWILPSLNLVIIMVISAFFFSLVLFLFLESFYYTDAYTLSAVTCFYPASIVAINWMLNKIPVPWPIIIGVMILALGGMIVIMINCRSIVIRGSSNEKL